MREEIVGSWKYVATGHYSDIVLTDGYFEPIENGDTLNFYTNNTFDVYYNNPINVNGTFDVTLQDSLLQRNFTPDSQGYSYFTIQKIIKLNSTTLELYDNYLGIGIDDHLTVHRYEKIITP